jgi:predicted alpha/beta hydrolase family esterase
LSPGLWNSGPKHWQSLWQAAHPDFIRVEQKNWETPRCADWTAQLDAFIKAENGNVVLATHSLGCATAVHWTSRATESVRGALLVAPSDVESLLYPKGTEGFVPMPLVRLPFKSIVVASSNDPYVSLERAAAFAAAWGSELINIGEAGHINTDAGFGAWPEGEKLLQRLRNG